ncbi:MAG TPA: hypothetical protein PLK76_01785 [bacterium]|nr:hypothetical protein [bacterium]
MLKDIFKIYNKLPEDIKNKISEPQRMQDLEEIEKRYNLSLAEYLIRILISDILPEKLSQILVNEKKIKLEIAEKINQELKLKIYGDVYNELVNRGLILVDDKENNLVNLEKKYNVFSISSLFQNILAAEESFKSKYFVGGILNTTGIKEEFYEALNSSDKIKVVGALRVLAGAGQLGASFASDQRYMDFWGNFLERHYGVEIKQKFLQEPSNKKYFLEFLRFALEKRLNFNTEESAMIGMGLASLCGEAGENDLAEMAYGDESKNGFVWNE